MSENNKNSPKATTVAADRIRARLEKKSITPQDTPMIEVSIPTEPQHEITLTDEMAQMYHALQQKWLTSQQVISMFLLKFQKEKNNENVSLLEIGKSEKILSLDTYQEVQKVSEIRRPVFGELPKPGKLDFILAHRLVEYKLLDRTLIQIYLRMLSNLLILDIDITLGDIIIGSKMLASDIITPLLDQCQKDIQEQKSAQVKIEISTNNIVSRPRKIYNIARWLYSLAGLLAILIFLVFYNISQQSSQIKQPTSRPPVKTSLPVPTAQPPAIITPPPFQPIPEDPDPKEIEKIMHGRGLSPWGTYWISQQQYTKLLTKYSPGSRPKQPEISYDISEIRIIENTQFSQIEIIGKLACDELPEGFIINVVTELCYADQTEPLAQHSFAMTPNKVFQMQWQGENDLPLGPYCLRIMLFPENQESFLRYFLSLETKHIWERWLVVGNHEQIVQYYEFCRKEWEDKLNSLSQQVAKITPTLTKSEWATVYTNMSTILDTISPTIARWEKGTHPFRNTLIAWKSLCSQLEEIEQCWIIWQEGLHPTPPDTSLLQMGWDVTYEETKAGLYQQSSKMLNILERTDLYYVRKK